MDRKKIFSLTDHTVLSPAAVWEDVKRVTDEGITLGAASVCIPPAYVKRAAEYSAGRLPICTVTGFPNGYSTTAVKVYETAEAVKNGADEIDTVINIGMVKDCRFDGVLSEIKEIRAACEGKILKVIIEACLLSREEKIRLCHIVTEAGADFIKTSTGFSKGGATVSDVALLKNNVGGNVKVKAAGGISSFEEAEKLIEAGAGRIGASRLAGILINGR